MKNGVLNVYKEAGFTSHDVVAKLRGVMVTYGNTHLYTSCKIRIYYMCSRTLPAG